MLLFLMIDGQPKCQSDRLRDAETLLIAADPDMYEVVKKVTCAYPAGPTTMEVRRRDMAIHNLRRVLGADAEIIWVDAWTHADALRSNGCYRAC